MNQIFSIHPYRPFVGSKGYVFDDVLAGLSGEPFVAGIPEMMNRAIELWNIDENKLICNFSAQKFPSSQLVHLEWLSEEYGGNWYVWKSEEMSGWFCPALFKYFPEAPKNLYIEFLQM